MGMPKKEVLPKGIKRRRQPVVDRFQFKNLDKISINAHENISTPQGINPGTNKCLEKVSSGILRRTKAGNDIYMTNKFNTVPVSVGKSDRRFKIMPISRNVIVTIKFSIL